MLREYFADFRPRPVPTIIAGLGIVLLLGLGTWQLFRLAEKNAINAFRAERAGAAAVPLPARVDDIAAWEFRRVTVTGMFDHAHELYLNGRSQRGNTGYDIITPLRRAEGPPVLINRGWVPYERKNPATRQAGQIAGVTTVEGILRTEPRRGWLMPANNAERNEWFWFDLPAMKQAAGVPDAAPFYIEAGPAPNPGNFPIGGQTIIQLQNNHLQYALTWYALAIALAVIYVVSQRAPVQTVEMRK
jgi:surfeit locus 1 family protein